MLVNAVLQKSCGAAIGKVKGALKVQLMQKKRMKERENAHAELESVYHCK